MIINNTGTFYVEGDYAQGDTILKAGDWELRANGSKNAFAYSPETFVRRNLLDWSEDFTGVGWERQNGILVSLTEQTSSSGAIFNRLRGSTTNVSNLQQRISSVPSAFSNPVQQEIWYSWTVKNVNTDGFRCFMFDGANRRGQIIYSFASNTVTSGQEFVVSVTTVGDEVTIVAKGLCNAGGVYTLLSPTTGDAWNDPDVELLATKAVMALPNQVEPYQRTTTHVPRPYAIKDELVTNGTFDTDIDGWVSVSQTNATATLQWANGQLELTKTGSSAGWVYNTAGMHLKQGIKYKISIDCTTSGNISFGFANTPDSVSDIFVVSGYAVRSGVQELEVTPTFDRTVYTIVGTTETAPMLFDNVSVKEVEYPITLGNGNHKNFRYYPKTLSQNEVLELVK